MQDLLSRVSVYHLKKAFWAEYESISGHEDIVKRLNRAYDILTVSKEYILTLVKNRPLTFNVEGPNDTYSVIESQRLCTCPDGTVLCKHRLAVRVLLSAIKLMKEEKFSIKQENS